MTRSSGGAGSTGHAPPAYIVPMPGTYPTEPTVTGLPAPQELIDAVRAAADPGRLLDKWAPAIDTLTDQAGAARFLGYTRDDGTPNGDTVRRKRYRKRADGTLEWPEPDRVFGRSPTWSYRTIVLHLATAPGPGHKGMARPATRARWDRYRAAKAG